VLGIATRGTIRVGPIDHTQLSVFIDYVKKTGSNVAVDDSHITFTHNGKIKPVDIVTATHPGFMTGSPTGRYSCRRPTGHPRFMRRSLRIDSRMCPK
jgi:hypothetical protein